MAMNFEERVEQIHAMIHDPDLALTPKEILELTYHWVRFEFAIRKANKVERLIKKHSDWLSNTTEIYNFRKDLASQ